MDSGKMIGVVAAVLAVMLLWAQPAAAVPDQVAPAGPLSPQQARGDQSARAVTGPWLFFNLHSGRCLDADTATIGGNGTKVHLWDCTPGATNQLWWLVNDYSLQNVRSLRYLDADMGTIRGNGTKVHLWDFGGVNIPNQSWTMGPYSPYSRTNVQSGRCLDADMATIGRNGTKVHLWDCAPGATNQEWSLLTPSAIA